MKKLGIAILLIISSLSLKASIKKDTTVVEFTDKGSKKRISVMTNGKKDFKIPSSLNLDNLLNEIGVDSSERKKAIVLVSQNGDKKDTILVISRDGRKIKIVTNEPKGIFGTTPNDTLRKDEQPPYQRKESESDNDAAPAPKHDSSNDRFFSSNDFSLYFGLNNWYSTNSATTAPSLSSLGSRYVAISWRKNITLAKGKKADLALSYAPEVAWYNFMFDGNKYANMNAGTNQIQFTDFPSGNLSKSKIVVPTLNLPIMLNIGLKESRFVFGAGGYVGYQIDGYTKIKYDNGGKDHNHQNFNLNNVRYGLTAEIGKKSGLKLFFRYDLNPLFKSDQKNASTLQGWSVGLIIL